jgi:hypothetical protein
MSGEFLNAVLFGRFCAEMGKQMQSHPHVFMRNKSFSSIRIVALWSVNKIFLESYDFTGRACYT